MHTQLNMIRNDLSNLPDIRLSGEYNLKTYKDGDSEAWENIISASFEKQKKEFNFHKIMRTDPAFRPERVCFIACRDKKVATASAFQQTDFLAGYGMIHYVGVLPEHKGRKLGYWVTLAALHQMAKECLSGAWLSTDDFRIPAIKTYLKLGFVPLKTHDNHRERWLKICSKLQQKDLWKSFSSILDGPIFDNSKKGVAV